MKQLIASIAIMFTSAVLVAQLSSTPLYTLKPNEKVVQLNEHRLGLSPSGNPNFVALTQRGDEKWVILNGKEFGPLSIDFSQLETRAVWGTNFGFTEEGFVRYPDGTTSFENKSYGKLSKIQNVFFNENGSQLLGIEERLADNETVLHLSSGKTYKIAGQIPNNRKPVKIKPNGSDIVYVHYSKSSKSETGDYIEIEYQLTPNDIFELGRNINNTFSNDVEINTYEVEKDKVWRLIIDGERYETINNPPLGSRLVVYKHNKPLQLEQSTNGSAIKQVAKEMLKPTFRTPVNRKAGIWL